MRVVGISMVGAAAAASVNNKIPSDGIAQMQTTLEEFQAEMTAEGKKAAVLYEEQACTFKDVFEKLKQAIKDNQGEYEAAEGERQGSQATFEHLTGDKLLDGSIAHTKAALARHTAKRNELVKEKKEDMAVAMKTISEAGEAIKLISGAAAALQAATEKVASIQSFVQIKEKLTALNMAHLMDQEQPEEHSTSHDQIVNMLDKLKQEVTSHLETTRSDWTIEENRLVGLIQAEEESMAQKKQKIEEDTKTMEDERANVLRLDQELHGLKIQIQSDTKVLKETTERADMVKENYDKDSATRVTELQTIDKARELLATKFDAAPEKVDVSDKKDEDDGAKPKACTLDPVDEPVTIPTVALLQKKASLLKKSVPMDRELQKELVEVLDVPSPASGKKLMALASVASSVKRGDPLKKIRIMIKNLIQKLKDESANELARHTYCTTEENNKQASRDQKKKDISKYETGLEKAQVSIADHKAKLANLNKLINEQKEACAAQNGQLDLELTLAKSENEIAQHGMSSLGEVIDVLRGEFFSDSNVGSMDSGYKGNQDAGASIIGMMEALQDQFQDTVEAMTEEEGKLNAAITTLLQDTSTDVADKRDQMSQLVQTGLTPAIDSFKSNGQNLYNTVQEYSLVTEELIVLKYDSDACADKQLTKEEELANLEAEIKALKDALEVLEAHGSF